MFHGKVLNKLSTGTTLLNLTAPFIFLARTGPEHPFTGPEPA
jgi:hypothetical protein